MKLFVLKQLSKESMTGYDFIKKCEEIMGYRPSAGSIYPILHGMEKDGIIYGIREGRRKIYSLTPKGKKFVNEINEMREEFYEKLRAILSAMAESFDEMELKKFMIIREYPELMKIISLLGEIDKEKARRILKKAYREMKNESNRN